MRNEEARRPFVIIEFHHVIFSNPATSRGHSGRPFPKQEFDRLKEELALPFAGVTAFLQAPAEGLWR
ncbi:hypothetical protein NKJ35_15260 [Mesorhizobium sp. M0136]|uniref:hypothetical protein n=1 Tax=Mesorhizobium sp. M0136 TaxID=2956890 RepID=UPI0033392EEE